MVGKRKLISFRFSAEMASAGVNHLRSTISWPSTTGSCSGGVTAAKKRVSKRSGCSSGVIQWAKYASRSVASISFSARSMSKKAGLAFWQAARYAS